MRLNAVTRRARPKPARATPAVTSEQRDALLPRFHLSWPGRPVQDQASEPLTYRDAIRGGEMVSKTGRPDPGDRIGLKNSGDFTKHVSLAHRTCQLTRLLRQSRIPSKSLARYTILGAHRGGLTHAEGTVEGFLSTIVQGASNA